MICEKCKEEIVQKIIVVVDRSGSMHGIEKDVIGGFNSFLAQQKALPGEPTLTLILFDHEYQVVHQDAPLSKVPDLTNLTYVPRGATALYDAIGMAITSAADASKVIVAIMTDGFENASKEWSREKVFDKIKDLEGQKGWEFIYLGANQDAMAVGTSMGMKAINTVSFDATTKGVSGMYTSMCNTVNQYRSNFTEE